MRSDPLNAPEAKSQQTVKLLLWTAVLSLLFGTFGLGSIIENSMRVARNALHKQRASGDIILIAIDDRSLSEVGEWPWPRATQAKLIDRATVSGAKKIFIDLSYDAPTNAADDQALAKAIANSGKVVLPVRAATATMKQVTGRVGTPMPMFAKHAEIAHIGVTYNYQHAVWKLPYSANLNGEVVPSFGAKIAGVEQSGDFKIDYSIRADTIPTIAAADLLRGRINRGDLAGKTAVIASFSEQIGDQYWIPGLGRMSGSVVQIVGAETLRQGHPVDMGWLGTTVFILVAIVGIFRLRSMQSRNAALACLAIGLVIGQFISETLLIFMDIVPGLFAITLWACRLNIQRWRQKGLVNHSTELPNLEALRLHKSGSDRILVAARIHNFAQIASTLASGNERDFVRQIVDRLQVADKVEQIFHGDEGVFAFFAGAEAAVGNHLEALHALFRAPIGTGDHSVDVAITFGVEAGSARSLGNRLGSALMAADEAWSDGLKWKYFDPERQEEVSWRLSLLGELDTAIDNGEVWLAFQPQVDLRSGTITGAEALARWTHPSKGPISPTEFVTVAEAHGRIGKLTDFVLERAISSAATINRRGIPFTIAVNLSARLLSERKLVDRVVELLRVHQLEPHKLTLELTETAALHNAGDGLIILDALRNRGVRIAIDDYGTGLSTLDYLKKVPANEIKIDQSFVKAMRVNRSDRLMVQSTIALAHSLGRTVVAEGVEDRQSLEDLRALDCDVAQGFAVGRPMGVRELVQRLRLQNGRRVA
ncbi:EAL domain-containing protein [Sphingomonas sp. GCM10030256]|uniref:EAL domain-containing protein n=1 Tax=Sphingomonas sp. GCM10030256 TaxID=3273427 RepID=UPI00360FC4F8